MEGELWGIIAEAFIGIDTSKSRNAGVEGGTTLRAFAVDQYPTYRGSRVG